MTKRSSKKSSGESIGRAKPLTPKAGVTKSGKRRYSGGGKVKK